jgi:hypothetical protein
MTSSKFTWMAIKENPSHGYFCASLSQPVDLSKRKPQQWAFILAEKIVPQLSEATFIAKEQAIRRRLVATDAELRELIEVKEDPEEDDDEMEEITTNTNS